MLLIPPFGYAEIHYRIPGIFSRLFLDEPEIIIDLPHRVNPGIPIPLFLLVKDAHRWPVKLEQIEVFLSREDSQTSIWRPPGSSATPVEWKLHKLAIDAECHERFAVYQFDLPRSLFSDNHNHLVWCRLTYRTNGRQKQTYQDNYRRPAAEPFSIFPSGQTLPSIDNLHWGDLHVHSSYTDDVLEFGAPLPATADCAKAAGLDFVAITDHAYDMDDDPDNYFRYDPQQQKWRRFLIEVDQLNRRNNGAVLLAGEEASVGNCKGQNVHCLLIGGRQFYPGNGDSGERLFSSRPNIGLTDLISRSRQEQPQALVAAAHPLERPSFPERLLLKRGYWQEEDLHSPGLDYWQILNGRSDAKFITSLHRWQQTICAGSKIGILGGTDAHGNFNRFRQISIPFWKMVNLQRQRLGEARTGLLLTAEPSTETILEALQKKRAVVSDGPLIWGSVSTKGMTATIGDTFPAGKAFVLELQARSTPEFGKLQEIRIYSGPPLTSYVIENLQPFSDDRELEFPEGLPGKFLYMECYSEFGLCVTNPIWLATDVNSHK